MGHSKDPRVQEIITILISEVEIATPILTRVSVFANHLLTLLSSGLHHAMAFGHRRVDLTALIYDNEFNFSFNQNSVVHSIAVMNINNKLIYYCYFNSVIFSINDRFNSYHKDFYFHIY